MITSAQKNKPRRIRTRLRPLGTDPSRRKLLDEIKELRKKLMLERQLLDEERQAVIEAGLDIEASRDRYVDLYDFAPVGYVTLNRGGCIVNINLTGAEMLGRDRAHLVRQPLMPFVAGPDRRKFLKHLTHAFSATEKEVTVELSFARKDGQPRLLQLTSIRRSERSPGVFVRTTLSDVTERHQMFRELQAARETLEQQVQERTVALQQAISRQQALERQMLKISERERERIGQDLHDGVAQLLTGAAYLSGVLQEKLTNIAPALAQEACRVLELVNEASTQTRALAHGLHPVTDEPLGLMDALRNLASQTHGVYKIRCRFHCPQPVAIDDNTTATHLYRIVQEAVQNAIKHSRASRLLIALQNHSETVTLTVKDNGTGFHDQAKPRLGIGLETMRHRARAIGGELIVRGQSGSGTEVVCSVRRG